MSDPIFSLTSGSVEATFDEAVASIQNYGFRQSVFEVERLTTAKSRRAGELTPGEILVLCPSTFQANYPQMKPGDRVHCTGLRKEDSGKSAVCRIRRMAEGYSRNNMAERK